MYMIKLATSFNVFIDLIQRPSEIARVKNLNLTGVLTEIGHSTIICTLFVSELFPSGKNNDLRVVTYFYWSDRTTYFLCAPDQWGRWDRLVVG